MAIDEGCNGSVSRGREWKWCMADGCRREEEVRWLLGWRERGKIVAEEMRVMLTSSYRLCIYEMDVSEGTWMLKRRDGRFRASTTRERRQGEDKGARWTLMRIK